MNEEQAYEEALSELRRKTVLKGLWAKALAFSEGDENKAKANYIRFRAEQIIATRGSRKDETRSRRNTDGVYIEGSHLIVPDGYIFPRICIASGVEMSTLPEATELSRSPLWTFATLFIHPFIFVILFFAMRKRGIVAFCLQDSIRRRIQLVRGSVVAWTLLAIILSTIAHGNSGTLAYVAVLAVLMTPCVWIYLRFGRTIHLVTVKSGALVLGGLPESIRRRVHDLGSPTPNERAHL